jgi:hypothetical protein
MKEYEILLIVLTISVFSIAFKITIEDLTIFKILKVKKIHMLFNSKKKWVRINKFIKHYVNYKLPPLDRITHNASKDHL